jgi:ferredoxin
VTLSANETCSSIAAALEAVGAKERHPQATVAREVRPAPERYRNALGRYKIERLASCAGCGQCVRLCPHGVHTKPDGYLFTLRPQDHLCIGPECAKTDHFCVARCPRKALRLSRNPSADAMGDPRWSSDLILSTWHMAATGHAPAGGLEYRHGASGGGFDRIHFSLPEKAPATADPRGIDTGLDLNRRRDGRPQVHIDIPVYGGGMSFGSVSIHTILAKARAAVAWNSFTCTGEGGYPDRQHAHFIDTIEGRALCHYALVAASRQFRTSSGLRATAYRHSPYRASALTALTHRSAAARFTSSKGSYPFVSRIRCEGSPSAFSRTMKSGV